MWLSDRTNSVVASKFSTASGSSWDLKVLDDGTARFFWANSGGAGNAVASTMPLPMGRIAVKVTLSVATGTVTFYTASTIAGPWTQLGAATAVGATSVFSSTSAVTIGANADLVQSGGFNSSPTKGANG
jgi:hypothetical protein